MLSDISQEITQLNEQRRRKSKVQQDLFQVERSLKEKSGLLEGLEQALRKEQVDVDRLEGLSLAGLFYTVLGSKEEQVQQERQELLAANLKYQQAKRAVSALREEKARLEKELSDLDGMDRKYQMLLTEKEALLKQAKPQIAAQLVSLSEQIANRGAEKHEIDEAITAANAVLTSLQQVLNALQSAEGWGTWDMLGGGLLSTAIKHSRIDEARSGVHDVQAQMSRFARELKDVQQDADLRIEIGELDTFADFFFDGLIVDWIVQSKIVDSLEQARMAYDKINRAVTDLERLRQSVQAQGQQLEQQRAALIEQG